MNDDVNPCPRSSSEALSEILGQEFKILDHGFVRVIDYMGNDSSIVQAARVSYGSGTKQVSQDKGLINYLMRNHHTTPFEMCEIKFHIKLPIFVARQWMRHRTSSINEYSGRYSVMEDECYIPNTENIYLQSTSNAQGRSDSALDHHKAKEIGQKMKELANHCYASYAEMIEDDIAREISRINLPLSCYTQFYWKINLHNLLHFLRLRADSHAQYEIREYANKILDIVKIWTPCTHDAFMNYRVNSYNLSQHGLDVVKNMLHGNTVDQNTSNISEREWNELMDAIDQKHLKISRKDK